MAELKTRPTRASVAGFIAAIKDEDVRKDCRNLVQLMKRASGKGPKMWGSAIVGFGAYHYVYASGREGDWFQVGFSPRKGKLALYFMIGLRPLEHRLKALGTYKRGGGCLYIKKLEDVDRSVLAAMVKQTCQSFSSR